MMSRNTKAPDISLSKLALIGNCQVNALIDDRGAFVWSCYPNFDGEPIFCQLLTPAPKPSEQQQVDMNPGEHSRWHGDNPATDGAFLIKLSGCNKITQHYEDHAPMLVTTMEAPGGAIEIVDFAPHMLLNERIFRPALFVRMVRPLRGMPLISVHCRPLIKYGEMRPGTARGSNHCRFKLSMHDVRLTTDMPVTFIEHERVFALTRASTMIFGPDETIERNVSEVGRHFHDSTLKFWHAWIQSLSIPYEFQAPVIHSAIVLKLCSVAETGAIIASVTTSIPEAPNTQRNWDYRFCWLRDSHFTVSALVELGKFDVLEDYISFVINVIHQQLQMSEPNYDDMDHPPLLTHNSSGKLVVKDTPSKTASQAAPVVTSASTATTLTSTSTAPTTTTVIDAAPAAEQHEPLVQPMFAIDLRAKLPESEVPCLLGYRRMGPVRIGNLAYLQKQNDGYGAVVLAVSHVFFDIRLKHIATPELFDLLVRLARIASRVYNTPDAGLWEFRGSAHIHLYSAVMCWAAVDRVARIATKLELTDVATDLSGVAKKMHADICKQTWNEQLQSFVSSFNGNDLDASLLLLAELQFVAPTDARFVSTVHAVAKRLKVGELLMRYAHADDFGKPEVAFIVCTFWYVMALTAIGERAEARRLFEILVSKRNAHGLLSEDLSLDGNDELWGNIPQTYSHVGLIMCARRLSKGWSTPY